MALTGTFEADGRTWTFRKPHVGPVLRFNEVLALAEEGNAKLSQLFGASLDVIRDAVARIDPGVTREQLADALDEDQIREFQAAIMKLSRPEGANPGER
jgi:hypothetical protein